MNMRDDFVQALSSIVSIQWRDAEFGRDPQKWRVPVRAVKVETPQIRKTSATEKFCAGSRRRRKQSEFRSYIFSLIRALISHQFTTGIIGARAPRMATRAAERGS